MTRISVKSSNIKGIGHDPRTNALEVEFQNGSVWHYLEVTPEEHANLMQAKSIGSHFASFIKPYKAGKKVSG